MRVAKLSLHNWRNYQNLEVEFAPGPVLVLGRNGQGKTNLAEAIAYFNDLSSHRVNADAPLLRAGQTSAAVRMQVVTQKSAPMLELELRSGQQKRAQINGNAVRARELTRYFTSVVFAPEDLLIVRGEPAARRAFLDAAIVTRMPLFAAIFREYERVVRQRSALLKQARKHGEPAGFEQMLEFWNAQLIDNGTRIMAERRRLIDQLTPHLKSSYAELVGQDHGPKLALKESGAQAENYLPQTGDVSHTGDVSRETLHAEFAEKLQKMARAELERGQTLVGPHRDELELQLNSLPVKGYASHGESWSMALALKLALAQLLRADNAPEDPVLILDDVFAELDVFRRQRLMSAVGEYEQVIVTAAVAGDIPTDCTWQTFVIKCGELIAQGSSTNPATDFELDGPA
ncbi:MAG: DNA replication/repair protein RecF [Microbacteriaceae bacterium]|nr:DNA replication/repair protein RecF [Microbacteriaceae bacterium]